MGDKQANLDGLKNGIINGKAEEAHSFTKMLLDDGVPVSEALNVATDAMMVVGEYYATQKYFLPQVLVSANAFEKAFSLIQPILLRDAEGKSPSARIIIGVCEGDIHDIGKKIVVAMLRGGGFEVHDLGRDVPNEDFIQSAKDMKADIVAMSALMSTSITEMKNFMDMAKEDGIRANIQVMIGGGSATPQFGETIGADGYGKTSADAVRVAEALSKKKKIGPVA
jgi:methylmalonyl-CoA mutase cobalamin-binding domain/chain